jgi:hypothetical protein
LRLKFHIFYFCCVGIICLTYFWDCIGLLAVCNFWKSPFYSRYNAEFFLGTNKKLIFLRIFLAYLVGYFCIIMSAGSPQRRVRQRTEEDVAAHRAKIMDRAVIPERERNVVRANIIVAPLDGINEIIQTYNWGYLHNCACVVLTKLAIN